MSRFRVTRRRFVGGLAGVGGVAVASLLAACGGSAPSSSAAPTVASNQAAAPTQAAAAPATAPAPTQAAQSAPAAAGQTKITYWGSFSGDNGKAEQELANRFNKAQNQIVLDYEFQGTYEQTAQKLSAALAAKQTPEVSLLSDVWWEKFWLGKVIVPVNPFMAAAKVSASDYVDAFANEGSRNGSFFWVPFARSTPLYYYNKDMFHAAGYDKAPETWDEVVSWGDKLAKRDGDKMTVSAYASPNDASYIAWVFQPVVWAYGGRYSDDQNNITIDQQPAIDAGTLFGDLVYKYKIASIPKDIVVDFTNGLAASMLASTASLATIEKTSKFSVGTAFLPKKVKFGCCTGGAGFGLLGTSPQEKQAAGFAWINFATGDDSTTYWSQTTGYMPVRKKAIASDQMAQFYQKHPNFQTAVKQLDLTQGQDWARVGIPNGDQIIGKGLDRIVVNHEDSATVMKDVAATLRKEGASVLKQLKAMGQ